MGRRLFDRKPLFLRGILSLGLLLVPAPAARAAHSLEFPGSGRVVVPHGAAFDLAGPLTIEIQARPESSEASYRTLITKGGRADAFTIRHGRTIQNNNTISASLVTDRGRYSVSWTPLCRPEHGLDRDFDGKWRHYALVYDGESLELFVDGYLRAGRTDVSGAPAPGSGDIFIGHSDPADINEPWSGLIGEVRIWSVARTPAEIRRDALARLEGETPGLVACWRFDEGEGTAIKDQVGGNHGTLIPPDGGAPRWSDNRLEALPPLRGGLELLAVRRIWDQARHNAFTALAFFRGHWYCAFREGHVHGNHSTGRVRVIRSEDGKDWRTMALMEHEDGDVRDAGLSVTPGGALMLNSAIRFLPPRNGQERQSVTWLSDDGEKWGQAHACATGVNTWRWKVTWHDGVGYSVGYSGRDRRGTLYRTRDGREWETLLEDMFPGGRGNEAALVFDPDGTAWCLLRDGPGRAGHIGRASPPYTDWTWRDTGMRLGGPEMIRLRDGRYLAAVRRHQPRRTVLAWLDPETGVLDDFLVLPSGGDTSYAGLVEHEGTIWMSYYSSHEGKSAVYLARLAILE